MKQSLRILLILLSGFVGVAQTVNHQSQIWANYNVQLPFKNQKSFQMEFSERVFTSPFQHALFAVRGIYRFPIKKNLDMGIGFANFNQTPTDPSVQPRLAIPEFRPNLDIVYKKSFKKITFENRFRLEPRFYQIPNAAKTELTSIVTLGAIRWRYRLQAMGSVSRKVDARIGAEILLNSEVNIPTRGLDQFRGIAGISYKFSNKVQLETAYIYQLQTKGTVDFFERDIFWLSLTQKLAFNH